MCGMCIVLYVLFFLLIFGLLILQICTSYCDIDLVIDMDRCYFRCQSIFDVQNVLVFSTLRMIFQTNRFQSIRLEFQIKALFIYPEFFQLKSLLDKTKVNLSFHFISHSRPILVSKLNGDKRAGGLKIFIQWNWNKQPNKRTFHLESSIEFPLQI